jgi:hypothetical protein
VGCSLDSVGEGGGSESVGPAEVVEKEVVGEGVVWEEAILEVGGVVGGADCSLLVVIVPIMAGIAAASRATSEGTTTTGFRHHGVFGELTIPPVRALGPCFSHCMIPCGPVELVLDRGNG